MDNYESMQLNESIASLIDVLEKINFNIEKQNQTLDKVSNYIHTISMSF
ncbi:MAG: hypothetical protein ACTTIZ_08300 [Treponema sp.]